MNYLRIETNATSVAFSRDGLSTAMIKNVFTVGLCVSIIYINGTLVHTFHKNQIFHLNPRYVLFIHLVINDIILLTMFVIIQVLSYIVFTINVSLCIFLVLVAVQVNLNTPLNLAMMAVECYIAVCLPLRHVQICTIKRISIAIGLIWVTSGLSHLPDLLVTVATEPREFFNSRVFCLHDTVIPNPILSTKRDVFYIVSLLLVWFTLFYTYFRILFAAKAVAADATKAKNTVLLHGIQLMLCMLTYVPHLVINGLSYLFPASLPAIRFTVYVVVQIVPRLISPIIYGLRDKTFRKYLKRHLLCKRHNGSEA